jgi:hypothetical protein
VVGGVYLLAGRPVTVLARWERTQPVGLRVKRVCGGAVVRERGRSAPRNVLVARPDGGRVVRPFRGLRRP